LDWLANSRQPNLSTIQTYEFYCPIGPEAAPTGWRTDPQTYRRMRFGLTTALLGDGFFAASPGSVELLWLDEYDNAGAGKGYLGQPVGSAYSVTPQKSDLLLGDGAFGTAAASNAWTLSALSPAVGTKTYDAGTCKVQVTSTGPNYRLNLTHPLSFVAGETYRVTFSAKASARHGVPVLIHDTTNGANYYADGMAGVTPEWSDFSVEVKATKTGKGTLNFYFGDFPGTVWFDNVTVCQTVPEVWRRDFTGGTSLVNASDSAATVDLGGTFRKIKGTQAPAVNDGSLVTAVTIPAKDGLVLLRTAATAPVPDTTAPSTTISGVPAGWARSDVSFGLTASDSGSPSVISTFYGLNAPASSAYTAPVTVSAQGATTVSYRSVDAAGNAETAKTATIRIDKTLPALSLDADASYTGSATIHASATDALSGLDRVELKLDGGSWTTATQISTSVLGAHTLYARAFDVAGNERDVSATFSVSAIPVPDPTAPLTTISGVPAGWVKGDVTFNLTASVAEAAASLTAADAGSPTAVSTFYGLNAPASSAYSAPVTVSAQGATTVSYRSVDAAGNAETAKTAAIRIDKTLPALSLDAVATYTSSATVRASATDALSGLDRVELKLDGGSWTTATQISTSVLGAHTLYARAFDAAGNERDVSATFSVSVIPVPDTTPPPAPGPTQATATLRASSTLLDYGKTTTLWIAVAPVSSVSVGIEQMTASSPEWAQVATLTTDANGVAQLSVTPLVTTDYRMVLVDTGTVSNVLTVGVKARATVRSSRTTIRRKRLVTMSGRVTTGVSSLVGVASMGSTPTVNAEVVRAILQRKAGRRWINVKRVSISSTGRYHVHIRPRARGAYRYRIRVASSGANAACVSRTIRIRVR
jgi:hypothetical protein